MSSSPHDPRNAPLDGEAACADEPIRIPGSIQPHGALLVLDAARRVTHRSDNLGAWLGACPAAASTLPALFGDVQGPLLDRALAGLAEGAAPVHLGDVPGAAGALACTGHRYAGRLFLEFEAAEDPALAARLNPLVQGLIAEMTHDAPVEALCQMAARAFKEVSGFGRAKVYRFDDTGDGEVLAEQADPGYARYLGQCFPASDIPAQARALYVANRLRQIPDAGYQPVAVRPVEASAPGPALDLSFASLRSVSPIHLQYMRNMGTQASLSVSIVVQGRLWGMISCHDHQPRALGVHRRAACDLLGRVLSLQIEARELHDRTRRQLAMRQTAERLLAAITASGDLADGLRAVPEDLLGFADACGCAVVSGERLELIGETPPRETVAALAAHLAGAAPRPLTFACACLGERLPTLGPLAGIAGVLALSISELHPDYLLWFRPERVRTFDWAGRPEKTLDSQGRLCPRSSFAAWRETARGCALEWTPAELEGAAGLRNALLGIVLRRAEVMASLADELTRSNKELEAFSCSVSHDLRAPLRHIAGYAELLGDFEGDRLSERGQRFLANIGDSARFAGTLVDNLLSFSQMGRAALHHSDVNLGALIEVIREEMRPDYQARALEWRIGALPVVVADAAFIHLALRNLIANAIKYTRGRDLAVIEVGSEVREQDTVVFVRDNGVGFDMAYVGKLFGVFQRLHHMDEFEGTGIGLASVRRIVERHEGRVWAEGVPGEGATFYFSLPHRSYTPLP